MSRRTIADWRRDVFRSASISDPVRVLLLLLADHMKTDRKVSVKRATIAAALGKSERRISERVSAAHEAGFLTTVAPGYRGHVPVYQGLFPEAERVTPTSTLSGAETRTLSKRKRVTPGGPTTTRADLSPRGDQHDEERSNEKRATRSVGASVTACPWHESGVGAPEDCACTTEDRRRTA